KEEQGLYRFFSKIIARRLHYRSLHRPRFFTGETNARGLPDIAWHGCTLNNPGWGDSGSHVLAFTVGGFGDEPDLHVMMNMDWQDLEFQLPEVPGRSWYRAVDTFQPSPNDVVDPGQEVEITSSTYRVNNRSVVVLMSK